MTPALTTILVATDFSPTSKEALSTATCWQNVLALPSTS